MENFSIILQDAGINKLKVIKEVRDFLNLSLREAKDLVDGAPSQLKSGISKSEAESIKITLEGVGAIVSIH